MTVDEPKTARHFALIGPTASGKSALAMELAREFGAELVSVDSMQVYRGMDIGTAKPTLAERDEVPHHLIDLVDPSGDFDLAEFQSEARRVLAGIESRGKRAILVGGTGLYLQAITDDLTLPGQFPEVRDELEKEDDIAGLYERLTAVDPDAAGKIEPDNKRRIVRALEVSIGSGRPFSSYGPGIDRFPQTRFHMVGLWLPRDQGAERIEQRVHQMMTDGWLTEVAELRQRYELSRTAAQALGYKELIAHLGGEIALDDAVDEIVRRTRAFARRQRVWFRRDPRITWFGYEGDPFSSLPCLLREYEAFVARIARESDVQS